MSKKIAYCVVRYPTLSQTFLQREIEGLRKHGLDVHVFGCRQFKFLKEADARVHFLKFKNFCDFFITLFSSIFHEPKLIFEFLALITKYRWNSFENFWANVWGLFTGIAFAKEMRKGKIQMAHGAWATLPATTAAVCARFLHIPFSFGAHAYDLYRHGGDGFLREKLGFAAFVHTTTQANVNHLSSMIEKEKIVLARRGLQQLPILQERKFSETMTWILSVGRLVPKKGHIYQMEACKILKDRGKKVFLKIIGDGPLKKSLENRISELNLTENVQILGALSPDEVAQAYQETDIFWHTGIVDSEGDRDGLPNVIPEAMAHGIPVISSNESGVIEAVQDGVTGLVVDITSSQALADAVEKIQTDSDLRKWLVHNARQWVEQNFSAEKNTAILAQRFSESISSF